MHQVQRLRVAIDAQIVSGTTGGVEQVVLGLASGLSSLPEGEEEFHFLVHPGSTEWLEPYIGGACRLLYGEPLPAYPRWQKWAKKLPATAKLSHTLPILSSRGLNRLPVSDGTIERASINVMHFVLQRAFVTSVPSIYHPWDLQHLYLPHLFTKRQIRLREMRYREYCKRAAIVSVASTWHKEDIARRYGISYGKIRVVPMAPPTAAYPVPSLEDITKAKMDLGLFENFAFYPAQTWPHKNHIRLLEAIADLRDASGLVIPLICTGKKTDHYVNIARTIDRLKLQDQVKFLGFVSPLEMQSIYRLARCLVFPTKFEGWGLPLTEAFEAGLPVACSNVTSLPLQVGEAALIFNPDDPFDIAEALRRVWTDDALRSRLSSLSRQRAADFSWDRTARLFRACYREIAGRELTDEDRALLSASPPA